MPISDPCHHLEKGQSVPIEVAVLAAGVVANFLVPYARMGAEKIAEAIANKASQAAADQTAGIAAQVWNRIKSAFDSDADKAVLQQFEQRPEEAKPLVEAMLKEKLEQDSQLRQDLEKLTTAPVQGGSGNSMQIMADTVGVADARWAHIHGGVVAGVYMDSPRQPSPSPPQPPDTDNSDRTS